jgi:hypothetical protein
MVDQNIINFIKNALSNGYSEDYVSNGLKAKGWPQSAINEALQVAKSQMKPQSVAKPGPLQQAANTQPQILKQPQQIVIKPQSQPIQIKSKTESAEKPKKSVSIKSISIPGLTFVGIFILLTFTILVYFYMDGITHYTIPDKDGKLLTKQCTQSDCSDLRAFALSAANQKFVLSLIIGLVVSALIVITYLILPEKGKGVFFWIMNGLYFLAIFFIAVKWIMFSMA